MQKLEFKMNYLKEIHGRYRKADRKEKSQILSEFTKTCRYNRKYATRILNAPLREKKESIKGPGSYAFSRKALSVIEDVWRASDYPWSLRLKAILSTWMPWIKKRYRLDHQTEDEIVSISPRQIDRRLAVKKRFLKRRFYGTTKPGTLLKHLIPIRTKSWDIAKAGYLEMDTVAHCGNSLEGEFIYTLNAVDIKTGWTERAAVMGKGETPVFNGILDIKNALPFLLKGIDSDNGGEFINDHLYRFCANSKPSIEFTRGRPYEKNDNAHVEQKNWTHVRKVFGWDRYDSPEAQDAMNDLYQNELRWWSNLFQPSVKLIEKKRLGSRLIRKHDKPKTPLERLAQCPQADAGKVAALKELMESLDPFELSQRIERRLKAVYPMAARKIRKSPAPRPQIAELKTWAYGKAARHKKKIRKSILDFELIS